MSFKNEYLEEILALNIIINQEKEISPVTIESIKNYLISIKELGKFSPSSWNHEWRKAIYKFGEHFKVLSPEKLFDVLDELISTSSSEFEIEVLEFVKIEVFLNFFTSDETIEYLENLVSRFRLNPEFKVSLAIFYLKEGKNELYSNYLRQALKLDKKNKDWLDSIYKHEYSHGKELIGKKKHEEADSYIQGIIDSKFYEDYYSSEYQNFFIFLKQRNDDQLLIENKLSDIQNSSKILIDDLFDKSRVKIIEILGFFTAIIAFIFGAVTISISLDLSSALILMCSFGFAMIVFILAISLAFTRPQTTIFKDKRMWVLIVILLINISLIFLSPRLVQIIDALS